MVLDTWNSKDLSVICKTSEKKIESALEYWVSQGVLRKTMSTGPSIWKCLDERQSVPESSLSGLQSIFIQDDSVDAKIEEMRVYWPYVMSMLNNMGNSLSLDRIHTLLSMFVQGPNKFKRTKEQLSLFMELMLKEEKVVKDGPLFKLNMKNQ